MTVRVVHLFGSWFSILVHSTFFATWLILGGNLEVLLVIVSLEAIYLGILILMAENEEVRVAKKIRDSQRQKDMSIVKQDVRVDLEALEEIKLLKKHIISLEKTIKSK